MELVKGDTLVIGSDGLFDNVFDHEIVSAVGTTSDDVTNTGKLLLAQYDCFDIILLSITF